MKEFKQWEVKLFGGGQIANTGDYDDVYYGITNGNTILYTSDDDDSDENEDHPFEALANSLNATKAKFWTNGDDEAYGYQLAAEYYEQHCEQLTARLTTKDKEIEKLKECIIKLYDGILQECRRQGVSEENCQKVRKEFFEEYKL